MGFSQILPIIKVMAESTDETEYDFDSYNVTILKMCKIYLTSNEKVSISFKFSGG